MERIKSKNAKLVYENSNDMLNIDIVKSFILNIGEEKNNKISIQNIIELENKIEVDFSFSRKSNYGLSVFNILYEKKTFKPKKISLKKPSQSNKQNINVINDNNIIIYEYILKDIIDTYKIKDSTKTIRGKYILLEYKINPHKGKYVLDEEHIIWNDPINHMSWFVLIKFNTRVQKRNAAHFATNGNTLLTIRVLSKDYYEILRKIIQKLKYESGNLCDISEKNR